MKPLILLFLCIFPIPTLGIESNRPKLKSESRTESSNSSTILTSGNGDDCKTVSGDAGKWSTFPDCFPILFEKAENEEEFDLDSALREDVHELNVNQTGKENSPFCCKIPIEEHSPQDKPKITEELSNSDYHHNFDFASDNSTETSTEDHTLSPVLPEMESCGKSFPAERFWNGQMYTKFQKITGGSPSPPGQYPWMVAMLGKNGKVTCGGSLINENFVLTAAHCLAAYKPTDIRQLRLHIGDYNLRSHSDGKHEVRRVSRISMHKGFDPKTYYNDIALIQMDRQVNFTEKIVPICLPQKESFSFDLNKLEAKRRNVVVTGWGRESKWGLESNVLRHVEIPLWKLEDCKNVYKRFAGQGVADRVKQGVNLCAGDGRRNKDACIGDSGGPLILLNRDSPAVQLGIVSWGKGCGSFPGVYTNVASYVGWIENSIRRLTERN